MGDPGPSAGGQCPTGPVAKRYFGDGLLVRVMVEFGTSSAFRGWVSVRVLG